MSDGRLWSCLERGSGSVALVRLLPSLSHEALAVPLPDPPGSSCSPRVPGKAGRVLFAVTEAEASSHPQVRYSVDKCTVDFPTLLHQCTSKQTWKDHYLIGVRR